MTEFCYEEGCNDPNIDFDYSKGCKGCPALNEHLGYCYTNEMRIDDLVLYIKDVVNRHGEDQT